MDSGVLNTQKIVVTAAVLIGLLILLIIGYSLYKKATVAQDELAKKVALDQVTKKSGDKASVSLTGESKNTSLFSFDNLTQKNSTDSSKDNSIQVVNETVPPNATDTLPAQEDIPTPANEDPTPIVTVRPKPRYIAKPVDYDRPLTAAEIRAIRSLPIDSSPSGVLQTKLEADSGGEYRARY